MIKKTILLLVAVLFISCQTAFALDLQSAKNKGLVGETQSGYLAPLKATPEAQQLVNSINAKRKALYQNIARKNGADLHSVEQLAGKKAIAKTPAGQFINIGGHWKRK